MFGVFIDPFVGHCSAAGFEQFLCMKREYSGEQQGNR
jgi:hypothetical protein